jgi:hypothetical protein
MKKFNEPCAGASDAEKEHCDKIASETDLFIRFPKTEECYYY